MHQPELALTDLEHTRSVVGDAWSGLRSARVFITGGTGFVGKWMLATLLHASRRLNLGCSAAVLSRNPARFREDFPSLANSPEVELLAGDVRDFQYPCNDFSHVIHAATDVVAECTPIETFDTCVVGTRRVLDLAVRSRVKDMLLVSSGAVYGPQPESLEAIPEEYLGAPDTLLPVSAYGEGKRATEWLGSAYAEQHGLRVKAARCFAFVGPYLALTKHFAIANFLRDAMTGNDISIRGDGSPLRTYLHASDMAAWLWLILLRGRTRTAYNVGGAEAVSILELAHRVQAVLGVALAVRTAKTPDPGAPVQRYVPNVDRARRELGISQPWGLDESIAATAQWYRAIGMPA